LSDRARIVPSSADGESDSPIAERLKMTEATVDTWRIRFIQRRIARPHDDVNPGKPRTTGEARVAQPIRAPLHIRPAKGETYWSVRSVAAETGISKTRVARDLRRFGFAAVPQRGPRAVPRPVLRREAARRGRLVPESAGQRTAACRLEITVVAESPSHHHDDRPAERCAPAQRYTSAACTNITSQLPSPVSSRLSELRQIQPSLPRASTS